MADKQVILTDPSTGDRLFPIVSADGIFNSDGSKLDLSSKADISQVGNLHVWRRTQQVGDKIPATYKLGPQESKSIYVAQPRQVSFSASVSVSDDGTISLVSPENITLTDNGGYISTLESSLRGKYATWDGLNGICFVPSSCSFSYASMFYTCSAVQMLIFVPAVPPGTYTDYPVSVNPNAYQTGPEIETGKFALTNPDTPNQRTYYSSSDEVKYQNGEAVLGPFASVNLNASEDDGNFETYVLGKYISASGGNQSPDFPLGGVYFIPSDAQKIIENGTLYTTKRAIIDASYFTTTVEYLGQLGDKSRMQIVSYVGTGTYGSGNKCTVTANFPIKLLTFIGQLSTDSSKTWKENSTEYSLNNVLVSLLTETPQSGIGFSVASRSTCITYASVDKKTVNWYTSSASKQLNQSGWEYYFLCRG